MIALLALHLWQSTLVVIAAWVLALACRRNAAALRYWIWFAASLKFLVPFALLQSLGDYIGRSLPAPVTVDAALIETGNAIFVPSVLRVAIADGTLTQIGTLVAALWALGTATLLLRWFLQWLSVYTKVASAPRLSMDLPAPVRVTSGDLGPGVFGVFRPVVILPRTVIRELRQEQMQTVLAHELCHVRRRDNLTAAIHKCIEAVFWFHPLVWWIGANLLREREAACDESVIEEGYEQAVYAESILHVCRLGVTSKFSGVAASTGGDLIQRMSSIMSKERASPIDLGRFLLLLAAAMIVLYGPIASGVIAGASPEAFASGPIDFDSLTLEPSQSESWRSAQFDPEAGRLALENVSLRQLISLAYPASTVNSDADLIDRARYNIEARWHGQASASETSVYRELLKKVLRTHSNLEIYIKGHPAAPRNLSGQALD